ncbi:hypothetical protein FRC09_010514 [Ceratobasidium sp. 395]|nr:hypothetical protein FRC09_010514 [Ceratobasidium sp. 395]
MVLAACAVSQLSYESSPAPHSLFLRQMASAAEALKSDVSIGKDLRASIIAFWNAVLLPIPVFKAGVYQSQYPQLVPRESQLVEFVSLLVRLIQRLRDSSPE